MSVFKSNFIENLSNKPYIRGPHARFGTSQVNILGVGLTPEQIQKYFDQCQLSSTLQDTEFAGTLWSCGDVSVYNIDHASQSEKTKEQLDIITKGLQEWAKPMIPVTRWNVRYYTGYHYNTEWQSFRNEPHGILVNGPLPQWMTDAIRKFHFANDFGVNELKRDVKKKFIDKHMDQRDEELKEYGYKEGKKAGGRKDSEKVKDCGELSAAALRSTDECNRRLNLAHEKGFGEGYAEGINDAQHAAGF